MAMELIMEHSRIIAILFMLLLYSGILHAANEDEATIKIHYLGHSAFVIEFDNGINIVTDYGHYNIWVDSGWDSPINSIGNLVPDVMTYSHLHPDHYDSSRIPFGVSHILTGNDSLEIEGISITPVRTCETSIFLETNSSYIFEYKGLTLCHLGDAQAQVMAIDNEDVKNRILEIIPDSLDMLFMTIEGTEQFIPEAEKFINLLHPKRIIPMHYWSDRYKRNFIMYLMGKKLEGKNYIISEIACSDYSLHGDDIASPVNVITLTRSEFDNTTKVKLNYIQTNFELDQNYPNPFNPSTKINFSIPSNNYVSLKIFDMIGREIETLIHKEKSQGNYEIEFNAPNLSSGVYFYRIQAGDFVETKKMLLLR